MRLPTSESGPKSWFPRGSWVVFVVPALALVITLATVSESARRGRLSGPPTADNIIYMAGGARLFAAFEKGGVSGLAHAYIQRPPHSPYAEMVACFSYLVLGVRESASSFAGALIPLCGLAWCLRLARGASPWVAVLLLISVAAVPIWTWSIEILKPDYFAGLATAIAVSILLGGRGLGHGKVSFAIAGVFLGLALWSKPTFLPATLLYSGVAFMLGSLVARPRTSLRGLVICGLVVAASAMSIAGPHLALVYKSESEYFWRQFAGASAESWRFHGTPWEHSTYYLTGPSGAVLFGRSIWVILGTVLLVGLPLCARFPAAVAHRSVSWLVCLALTLGVPAVSRMKVTEFATTFDFLLLFAFVRSVAVLARVRGRIFPGAPVVLGIAAVAAAVSVGSFRWTLPLSPSSPQTSPRPTLAEQAIVAHDVFDAVERSSGGQPARVLILGTRGLINHNLFEFWAVRDQVSLSTSLVRKNLSDLDFAARLGAADILVANDGLTTMTEPEGASGLSCELLARVAADGAWEEQARVAVPGTQGRFVVFVRHASRP
jgi:hypothetical protein